MEQDNGSFDLRTIGSARFRSMFDTEVNIKVRVLSIVALAGAVGNTLGFLANLFLYGFNVVTAFCFLCAVLIICNLFFGLRSRHSVPLGYAMLLLLDVLEFPLLTLTYGAVMYPYMIIGFHALAMVTEKRKRVIMCILLGVYDLGIIFCSFRYPYIFGPQDPIGLLGSAVITFAISVFTVACLVIMWQNVFLVETSEVDPVTRVQSRAGFNRNAARLLSDDPAGSYVILYFNVLSFKAVNSVFGIEGGNRFLSAVAQRLTRAPFSPELVGRLNGDRFVCLVKKEQFHPACLEDVCRLSYEEKERTFLAQLSCGIYDITDRSLPVSAMCDRACAALRYIHDSGSRFCAVYDSRAESGLRDETELLGEIENAIRGEQFVPYYQPIVDCGSGKVVSAEALARWIHPERGVISPSVFIPVLEKKDLISKLDSSIAVQVHELLKRRIGEGERIVPVSVNLSRSDLYDSSMMAELKSMVRDAEPERKWHRFEITESVYEDMTSYTLNTLSALRKSGAVILVDDFGSGYSSLGMITDYEFDIIKLDIQFAAKIAGSDKIHGVVQCLIDMAHSLGAKVIAEGIETEEQYQALRDCGCDYAQGYYFYRAMPEEAFLALLDSSAE